LNWFMRRLVAYEVFDHCARKEVVTFAHMLLPTDGSELSERAIAKGILLAKESNAKVTGISMAPEFHVLTFNTTMLEGTKAQFVADSRAQATKNLAALQKAAAEVGVPCDTVVEVGDGPQDAVIHTAESNACEFILMASHGRRGVKNLLLGSETVKGLRHSRIPVLVYREVHRLRGPSRNSLRLSTCRCR
jgi:nucleotide-binding universal stress UspA family protein